jgi:ribosomal protein S12 methylthiotransferase accessory factor
MTIEITFDGNKKVSAKLGDQVIHTDQPVKAGGEGTAPSPFDLFLTSIGTCAGFYVKTFCDQRGISTDNIKIFQHLSWNQETKLYDKIEIEIDIPADFPENYREAMLRTAELCTVKKHLMHPPEIKVIAKTI